MHSTNDSLRSVVASCWSHRQSAAQLAAQLCALGSVAQHELCEVLLQYVGAGARPNALAVSYLNQCICSRLIGQEELATSLAASPKFCAPGETAFWQKATELLRTALTLPLPFDTVKWKVSSSVDGDAGLRLARGMAQAVRQLLHMAVQCLPALEQGMSAPFAAVVDVLRAWAELPRNLCLVALAATTNQALGQSLQALLQELQQKIMSTGPVPQFPALLSTLKNMAAASWMELLPAKTPQQQPPLPLPAQKTLGVVCFAFAEMNCRMTASITLRAQALLAAIPHPYPEHLQYLFLQMWFNLFSQWEATGGGSALCLVRVPLIIRTLHALAPALNVASAAEEGLETLLMTHTSLAKRVASRLPGKESVFAEMKQHLSAQNTVLDYTAETGLLSESELSARLSALCDAKGEEQIHAVLSQLMSNAENILEGFYSRFQLGDFCGALSSIHHQLLEASAVSVRVNQALQMVLVLEQYVEHKMQVPMAGPWPGADDNSNTIAAALCSALVQSFFVDQSSAPTLQGEQTQHVVPALQLTAHHTFAAVRKRTMPPAKAVQDIGALAKFMPAAVVVFVAQLLAEGSSAEAAAAESQLNLDQLTAIAKTLEGPVGTVVAAVCACIVARAKAAKSAQTLAQLAAKPLETGLAAGDIVHVGLLFRRSGLQGFLESVIEAIVVSTGEAEQAARACELALCMLYTSQDTVPLSVFKALFGTSPGRTPATAQAHTLATLAVGVAVHACSVASTAGEPAAKQGRADIPSPRELCGVLVDQCGRLLEGPLSTASHYSLQALRLLTCSNVACPPLHAALSQAGPRLREKTLLVLRKFSSLHLLPHFLDMTSEEDLRCCAVLFCLPVLPDVF
eukprot:m.228494 g.228494  ORF g.228494 m.228494 type:complete len:855 (+) comp22387_c0_seq1:77-2641(+)